MEDLAPIIHDISYRALPLLVAIVLHEYAHGWVAHYFGDPTAKLAGRLTLNPKAHIDPMGSIIVPLLCFLSPGNFLFGWAKPVPIDVRRLRNPRQDMAYVAAAGPAMNFALAILSALLLTVIFMIDPTLAENWPPQSGTEFRTDLTGMVLLPLVAMSVFSILINVVLMVFNLLPVPPLDGGRILTSLLPRGPALSLSRIEPYGMFVVLGIVFFIEPKVHLIQTMIGTVFQFLAATVLPEQLLA